ncbi:MAG: hypothetical protein MHM6MM_005192, partial [Cercozoa sp. M6MM]
MKLLITSLLLPALALAETQSRQDYWQSMYSGSGKGGKPGSGQTYVSAGDKSNDGKVYATGNGNKGNGGSNTGMYDTKMACPSAYGNDDDIKMMCPTGYSYGGADGYTAKCLGGTIHVPYGTSCAPDIPL